MPCGLEIKTTWSIKFRWFPVNMFFHEGVTTKIFEVVAITFAWDGVQSTNKQKEISFERCWNSTPGSSEWPFWMFYLWPLKGLSDLRLGDQKVIWKKLAGDKCHRRISKQKNMITCCTRCRHGRKMRYTVYLSSHLNYPLAYTHIAGTKINLSKMYFHVCPKFVAKQWLPGTLLLKTSPTNRVEKKQVDLFELVELCPRGNIFHCAPPISDLLSLYSMRQSHLPLPAVRRFSPDSQDPYMDP